MMRPLSVPVFLAVLLCTGPGQGDDAPYAKVQKLLDTSVTVLGQPVSYPTGGPAKLTSLIVTLAPGEETSRHKHAVPLFGYILEGEVSIDYEGRETKTFRAGDALIEGLDVWHVGWNSGDGPLRILAVFLGAEGAANTLTHQP